MSIVGDKHESMSRCAHLSLGSGSVALCVTCFKHTHTSSFTWILDVGGYQEIHPGLFFFLNLKWGCPSRTPKLVTQRAMFGRKLKFKSYIQDFLLGAKLRANVVMGVCGIFHYYFCGP